MASGDIPALFVHLQTTATTEREPLPETNLHFPFNTRLSIIVRDALSQGWERLIGKQQYQKGYWTNMGEIARGCSGEVDDLIQYRQKMCAVTSLKTDQGSLCKSRLAGSIS